MNGKILIIPDHRLYDTSGTITVAAAATILRKLNSWLADRKDLIKLLVAECLEHNINIIYMLALAQKEQSALFRSTPPSQKAQDWFYGYGCPESGGRMLQYKGIENQIRSATAQLRRYDKWDAVAKWKGKAVEVFDSAAYLKTQGIAGKTVVPDSKAEAASLLYNPRVEGLVNQAAIIDKILKAVV